MINEGSQARWSLSLLYVVLLIPSWPDRPECKSSDVRGGILGPNGNKDALSCYESLLDTM